MWSSAFSIEINDIVEQPFSLAPCETLTSPNHHEGSSRNTLSLEFGVSDVRAIPSRDLSA